MTTAADVQALLRFLSQDAKVPLAVAMGKMKDLQSASLTSPAAIMKSNLQTIQAIFTDEKLSKQILSAAKRISKKRASTETSNTSLSKRKKSMYDEEPLTPAAIEESLALPLSSVNEEEISKAVLYTNRAPLLLAFAVTLLKYTMPEQPLSSRLSVAQAMVSVGAKARAVTLGIDRGRTAEDEGWGQGQPVEKVMGREVRVLKRWGYEWKEEATEGMENTVKTEAGIQQTLKSLTKSETVEQHFDTPPALWGMDLDALRKSNGPLIPGPQARNTSDLPIHSPQSARAYIFKAFANPPSTEATDLHSQMSTPKKKSGAALTVEKERNLGLLLGALDLLYSSWAHVLGRDELDRRAWTWYVHVRPEVEHGVAGWGGKGKVKLAEFLALRRKG
ncbi:MAG: hypothetical protein M1827_002749 [Pycnora praestabilis]|nr:MAG: hypothetical protein M1827_002749 [Pycnora praestabilis]